MLNRTALAALVAICVLVANAGPAAAGEGIVTHFNLADANGCVITVDDLLLCQQLTGEQNFIALPSNAAIGQINELNMRGTVTISDGTTTWTTIYDPWHAVNVQWNGSGGPNGFSGTLMVTNRVVLTNTTSSSQGSLTCTLTDFFHQVNVTIQFDRASFTCP